MAESPRRKPASHTSGRRAGEVNRADSPRAAHADLATGAGLGKYRILERIRTTRNGAIYKARDTLLDRLVALKRMNPALIDDPIACGDFRREAQMMARCGRSSRHVVGIHELIEDDHGLFIVQDYVEGRWLEALLSKRQLDAPHVLRTFGTMALGLRAVHAEHIVHRDIRPSNIIIAPDIGAVLADLSSAAVEGDTGADPPETARYAAPELLLASEYDDRIDIYSMGIILYEMCVGRILWHRHFADILEEPARADEHWRDWHTDFSTRLPPASELNPSVPPVLAAIVDRMTAKRLDERFSSIDEVISTLSRFLKRRRQESERRLPGPTPFRMAQQGLLSSSPRLVASAIRSRGPALPAGPAAALGTSGQQTTTHRVGGTVRSGPVDLSRKSLSARQASPAHRRDSAIQTIRTRRQPVLRARRPVVAAESIPTPDPVVEVAKADGSSRRLATVAGIVLFLGVVVSGTVAWYYKYGPGASHPIAAMFDAGERAYETKDYDKARARFEAVAATQAPGRFDFLHSAAGWWILLVDADRAIDDRDAKLATELLAQAETRGADRSRVAAVRQRIQDHLLAAELERDLAKGDLDGIQAKLRALGNRSPDAKLKSTALKARNHVTQSRTQEQHDDAMRGARTALDASDFAGALLACSRARKILDTPDVRDLERHIKKMQRRDEWIRRGDAAMFDRDFEAAVTAYDEANRLRPARDVEVKTQAARAHLLLAEAHVAIAAGDLLVARRKLLNSRWHYPLPEAAMKLRAYEAAFKAARLAQQGDRAAQADDLDRAIDFFEEALIDLPSPAKAAVQAKLSKIRRRQADELKGATSGNRP